MAVDPLWIEHMHMNKGALSRKAKKAGKSTSEFASEKSGASGTVGREARLAQTLGGLRKHKGNSQAKALRG